MPDCDHRQQSQGEQLRSQRRSLRGSPDGSGIDFNPERDFESVRNQGLPAWQPLRGFQINCCHVLMNGRSDAGWSDGR